MIAHHVNMAKGRWHGTQGERLSGSGFAAGYKYSPWQHQKTKRDDPRSWRSNPLLSFGLFWVRCSTGASPFRLAPGGPVVDGQASPIRLYAGVGLSWRGPTPGDQISALPVHNGTWLKVHVPTAYLLNTSSNLTLRVENASYYLPRWSEAGLELF